MIKLPAKLRRGPKFLRRSINDIIDCMSRTRVLDAYVTNETPRGVALNIPSVSGGVVAAPVTPLTLKDASIVGTAKVRVVYGTIGGKTPTGMSDGDTPPYALAVVGSGKVFAVLSVDDNGSPTDCTLDTGAEIPADDDNTAHLELGSYVVVAAATPTSAPTVTIAQNVTGSQSYLRCRNWFSNPATYNHSFGLI